MANTRFLDTVCRIYKNEAGKILAADSIDITVNVLQLNAGTRDDSGDLIQKILVSVDTIRRKRELFHFQTAGDRLIIKIEMTGHYSSIEENSGNFLVLQWNNFIPGGNILEIRLLPTHVALLRETI